MQLKFLFISVFIKTETALITFELNFSSCLFISILKTSNGVSLVEFSKILFTNTFVYDKINLPNKTE